MSLTPTVACRTAIKVIIDNANLGVDVHDKGLPYGGVRARQVIISQPWGVLQTYGGENYAAGLKGGDITVQLQIDVWQDSATQRDIVADQILALIDLNRAWLRSTYGIFDLVLLEYHDVLTRSMPTDPTEGVLLYRKLLRYSMKIPLTRAA
jgi:hypothetical protein